MSPEILALLPVIIGGLGALACLIGAFRVLRRKRLIDDVPTSKAHGVFIGVAELKGTAESEEPLTSHLAGTSCVQYSWRVEEHWSRTVHETYTDAQGHLQSRTRTDSGWTKVAGGERSDLFYLKDDTGLIRIVPIGATINGITTFNQTCSPANALYFAKGPAREIADSTHRRRFQETALPLHAMLYIMGQARERPDVVAAEIAFDKNAPMFLISTRTEKQISGAYGRWLWFWLILGLASAAGGVAVWDNGVTWQAPVTAAGGFIMALLLGWVWTVYNSLVNLHHMVEQGWSQVDVQIKRRQDLIPNLVKTVAGYRNHEKEAQQLLTELRTQVGATLSGVAVPDLKGIAPVLRVMIESYPELKANESFMKLQQSLVDAEQRIALARDYFNNIATFYNTRLEIIPDRWVARMAGFYLHPLMSTTDFERASVQVNLVS